MTNPFKRGSAPGRGQPDYLRPGTFKPRHAKRGGRKRGTPNAFSADYKKAIIEAAHRVGWDANGLLGVIGYLAYVACDYPETFCRMLGSLMELQELEIGMPEKPRPTVEELDEKVRAYVGLRSDERTQPEPAELGSPADRTRPKDGGKRNAPGPSTRKRSNSKARTQKQAQSSDAALPWAWTGQDAPVGPLMHLAITDPKEFCTLIQAAFLPRPTARQRERAAWQRQLAARRAWEERLRAEERRRAEERMRAEQDSGGAS